MTAVLESHSVARTGADLNHFVRKILNIENLSVCKVKFLSFSKALELNHIFPCVRKGVKLHYNLLVCIVINPLIN